MELEFETHGFYEPGFLHLRVNTDEDLGDLNRLATDPATATYFSTFLHEYIHFLQNVTTTAGLLTSVHYIDLIKAVNFEVINDGQDTFKVPFEVTNQHNVAANIALRKIYLGHAGDIAYIKYDGYLRERQSISDRDGRAVSPELFKIFYYDQSRQSRNFYFGSRCLTEYVAHAVQQLFFPGVSHPDVPYLAPELILNNEYPGFGADTMLIAALCDACMMSFHPAQLFFNTIERMKKDQFVPANAQDVYAFVFKDLTFQGPGQSFTADQLFAYIADLALKQYADALRSAVFAPNLRWVTHVFSEARSLRFSKIGFMTDLVAGKGRLSPTFYGIFKKLGTPFFTNKKMSGGFIPPENLDPAGIQPYQLLVFKEILNVYQGQSLCGLFAFCKQRPDKDITNVHCTTAPWLRGAEADLCPFGQFWKTWGLNGQVPVAGNP